MLPKKRERTSKDSICLIGKACTSCDCSFGIAMELPLGLALLRLQPGGSLSF